MMATSIAQLEAINYQKLLKHALTQARASGLFPRTLTTTSSAAIYNHASSRLPTAGKMRDLAVCSQTIASAVITCASETCDPGVRDHGGLMLVLNSLVAEEVGRVALHAMERRSSTASGGSGNKQDTTAQGPAITNALSALTGIDAQVEWLLMQVEEPPQQYEYFKRILLRCGADIVWQLLLATNDALENNYPVCLTAQGRQRTVGGVFMQLAKNVTAAAKTAEVVATAPAPFQLRQYQLGCISAIMAPQKNFIVAAPTGSGKTAIFVECARRVLCANNSAKVLVVVPTVPLTTQHYAQFLKSGNEFGPRGWPIEHFSGEKQLLPVEWTPALKRLSVVICTAQMVLNALQSGYWELEQLDLLVLDECHHAAKDDPYNIIVQHYNPVTNTRTKVLAFSASPVNGATQIELDRKMVLLRSRLHADLSIIQEDNVEVAVVISTPTERVIMVGARPSDGQVADVLTEYIWQAAVETGNALLTASRQPGTTPYTQGEVAQQSGLLADAVGHRFSVAKASPLVELEKWNHQVQSMAQRLKLTNLLLCCDLIDNACRALSLVANAGYEAALQYLARKCCGLATLYHEAGREKVAAVTNGSSPLLEPALAAAARVRAAAAAQAEDAPGTGALSSLQWHVRNGPSAYDVMQAVKQRGSRAAQLVGEGCPDITGTSVMSLARSFLALEHLNSPEGLPHVQSCFPSGQLSEAQTFPKLWALLNYLQGFRDRPNGFHGIVFVGMRQVVYFLADIIRRCDQLSFVEVCEFTGHGAGTGNKGDLRGTSEAKDRHLRGFSGAQQQRAIDVFREPGHKLLIATSAAEEGIDVPNCEFVLRYNAAGTGTQRLQSRGRARVLEGSEFVCLMQENTQDMHLHQKSQREEDAMRLYMSSIANKSQRTG